MPTKLLVIGLDSYDRDLLLEWTASGDLPNLARLLRGSAWGLTEPPPAVYAGAVWPSFIMATSPAHHRRFFRRQARRGEYLDRAFLPEDIQGVPFWDVLGRSGCRVAVLDVPHSTLSQDLDGIQLVDWASHEPENEQALAHPRSLRDEVISRFGLEPPDLCESVPPTSEGHRVLRRHLESRIRNRTAMSHYYLDSATWDLFITVFGEAHCAGHQWWHLHDSTHPAHDPHLLAATGNLMKEIYVALDRAVGELIEGLPAATRVMVWCSHGMGPLYGESVVLDEILRRLGSPSPTADSGAVFAALKKVWYAVPSRLRASRPLSHLRRKAQSSLHRSLLVPDRRSRPFFAIPHNPHAGGIRINLVGRESHGMVRPGEEYRAACAELRRQLLMLECADTRRPAVEEVCITADLYDGPFADELPDLTVEWSRRAPIRRLRAPGIGTVTIPMVAGRTGDHRPGGMFIVPNGGLEPRRIEPPVAVVDLAPTFAAWLGKSTDDFAGQPVPELLSLPCW